MSDKILITDLRKLKSKGQPIVAITAYDFPFARLADSCGVDLILVGDSLGTTVQGNATTIPVTLDQMIYHTEIVSRAARRALVVGDMPFLSYQVSGDEAVLAAGRILKEGRAGAVKLEGGAIRAPLIARLVSEGIPVMGHIGLLPQSFHATGGYRIRGREAEERSAILADAAALSEAGAFAIVLEGMPATAAAEVTAAIQPPTIGIGAGIGCDGQILVMHDLLGFTGSREPKKLPKFVKQYADLDSSIATAISNYADEVRGRKFPGSGQSYE